MKLNKEIHPNDLASAIKNFIFYLNLFKERINDLNVFPVPDGDTGTNMHLTLKDLDKIIETPTRLPDFLKDIAHTTLMGARGNSGVILSQFFKALLNSYEKNGSLTINSFSETFLIAAKITRESLPNPVEGTMLTIYDDIGKVDCTVFYPDKELYNIELAKNKSWFGTMYSMFKYFIISKLKKDIELKYNLIGT